MRINLLIIQFLITPLFFAQTKKVENPAIIDLRNQIRESRVNAPVRSDLNASQNALLEKKHKAKIDAELRLIDERVILLEGALYERVNSIFLKILKSNPSLPSDSRLVLFRDNSFNAFTMGEHVIFVNVGLLNSVQNESQIALVLAHELAHNSLNHSESSLVQSVLLETDQALKSEIKTIAKNQYGQVTELNKLLVPRIMESKEVSRKHEFSADSLGFIYMKNAGYIVKEAFTLFPVMEKQSKNVAEPIVFTTLFHFDIFPELQVKSEEYEREGSLGTFKKDTSMVAYLASHPYDRDRFMKLTKLENVDTVFEHYQPKKEVTELNTIANKENIKTAFRLRNLTDVIYLSFRRLELIPTDTFALISMTIALETLQFTKEKRLSGRYLSLQDPSQPEDIDRMAAFLNALSPKECLDLATTFKQRFTIETNGNTEFCLLRLLEYTRNLEYDNIKALWDSYQLQIHASSYDWILTEVETWLYKTKSFRLTKNN